MPWLARSAARPLPNKAFGFAGDPIFGGASPLSQGGLNGKASQVGVYLPSRSPHPPQRARWGTFPQGKAWRAAFGRPGVIEGGAPWDPTTAQRSTRKGYAASVRRQSRQRLRCGRGRERRSKGAGAVFAVPAETELSALCDDEGRALALRNILPTVCRARRPGAPQNFPPPAEIFLYSREKLWYAVRA